MINDILQEQWTIYNNIFSAPFQTMPLISWRSRRITIQLNAQRYTNARKQSISKLLAMIAPGSSPFWWICCKGLHPVVWCIRPLVFFVLQDVFPLFLRDLACEERAENTLCSGSLDGYIQVSAINSGEWIQLVVKLSQQVMIHLL